jgi:hypothetical protein
MISDESIDFFICTYAEDGMPPYMIGTYIRIVGELYHDKG